jgi:hypothetical protein
MGYYGPLETWKIVYYPKPMPASGSMGVAFVEADCDHAAHQAFREQYGENHNGIYSCTKLNG